MPRYFFNIHGTTSDLDEEGCTLADLGAARTAAVAMSGELLRDNAAHIWDGDLWRMDVTDERGSVVFTLNLAAQAPQSMVRANEESS